MKEKIINILSLLEKYNKITNEQKQILENYYLSDTRSVEEIKAELKKMNENPVYTEQKLSEINNQNVQVPRILIAVNDIEKDGKRYLKLVYSDNTVKVCENTLSENGQIIFEVLRANPHNDVTAFFDILTRKANEIDLSVLETEENTNNQVINTHQKRLGSHPGVGNFFSSFTGKEGFMNLLFFIFLTGISSGIILMITLNLLLK